MASILPDWRRANSWFAVVSADTAPLVPLEPAAQDDPDGHPLDLRYRCVTAVRGLSRSIDRQSN